MEALWEQLLCGFPTQEEVKLENDKVVFLFYLGFQFFTWS